MTAFITSLILQFQCPPSVDESLIMALILRESNGRQDRISSLGAIGLLQIRPVVLIDYNRRHGSDYDDADLLDPIINLRVGVWHLCRYRVKTSFATHLLQIYFLGYGRWKEVVRDPDHGLWKKAHWYTRSIYARKEVIKGLARLEEMRE